MINKHVTRRLERLEQQMPSTDVVKFWQIVTIDSAGNVEHGPSYEFPAVPASDFRPTMRP
jgi:hypothetical protein